jgi:phosphatidylglycerophosphatase A
MKTKLSLIISTAFYIGFIPGAPGTYASAATALIYHLFYRWSHNIISELHLSVICLISVAGVFTAAETSRSSGHEDPSIVVIDEVAGQLLTYLFVPVTAINLVLGFGLFRLFDIWKPSPIHKLERLKGGVGIMADDLAAGIFANVILQLLNWLIPK